MKKEQVWEFVKKWYKDAAALVFITLAVTVLVVHFLGLRGQDVRIELFFYRLAIFAEHSGVITVRIIFYRATSVILNFVKCKRHTELHTETEHFRNFLALVSYHFLVHLHCTQVIDSISQEQFSTY